MANVGSDLLTGAFEGAFKVLDSWAKVEQEKSKIKKEMMKERLKKEQNFMFKIAEKEHLDPIQRAQLEQYENQQSQGGPQIPGYVGGQAQPGQVNPMGQEGYPNVPTMHGGSGVEQKDIFDAPIQPQQELRPSGRGFEGSTPKAKDFIYKMIQQKKSRNIPISEKEQKFEDEYMFGKPGKGKASGKDKAIDTKKILDLAKDLAKSEYGLGGYESPSIEQLQEQIPIARKRLEDEAALLEGGVLSDTEQAGASSLPPEVDTPNYWSNLGIKGEEDAKNHLMETYSLTEDEAIQWLMGD